MLTFVAFSLIAQNVLYTCAGPVMTPGWLVSLLSRWSCLFSVLASNVCSYSMDASLSNPIGQKYFRKS